MILTLEQPKIRHTCGKNSYPTEGEARRAQYKVMIGHGTLDLRSRVYKCHFGNHFHHGRIKIKETK
jgi:hypothetical protein